MFEVIAKAVQMMHCLKLECGKRQHIKEGNRDELNSQTRMRTRDDAELGDSAMITCDANVHVRPQS